MRKYIVTTLFVFSIHSFFAQAIMNDAYKEKIIALIQSYEKTINTEGDPLLLKKEKYKKIYSSDKDLSCLDNWAEFEENNPETFTGMYLFYADKL